MNKSVANLALVIGLSPCLATTLVACGGGSDTTPSPSESPTKSPNG